jgi:hypothetical protein
MIQLGSGVDFVIVREVVEVESPFVITFHALSICDRKDNHGDYYIGCIVGDPYHDAAFNLRMQRIRGRLDCKNMAYHNGWSRINLKAVRRKSQEEKYRAKCTKLKNEYERRRANILSASNLFAGDELAALDKDYAVTLVKVKEMYCHAD